uniref:Uncharacterized protein n=1 Tax=Heliothis virescens TaxID=7102 RepID=A0A2A4IZM3_HELVI
MDKDKLIEILKPFINVPSQNNIPGLEVIPNAPALPPLVPADVPSAIGDDEVNLEQQVILEEPIGVFPEILSKPDIAVFNTDAQPVTFELSDIPDAPVLPPLVLNNVPAAIEEEIKMEEQSISGQPDITVINTEPKPITVEVSAIPEAPILPPLALDKISLAIEEEVKLEDQLISEKHKEVHPPMSVLPSLPKPIAIDANPKPVSSKLPIISELPEIPPRDLADVPSLYPEIPEILAEPEITVINIEPKPVTAEILDIPEAPVLPPLALDKIPVFGTEEQLISEKPTETYPTMSVRPSQPELVAIQTKPVAPEFTIIPEPPVLSPLTINNIPSASGEEIKLDEQLISQRPTSVFSAQVIPEAPMLPPLALDKIPLAIEEVKLEDQLVSEEHKKGYHPFSVLPPLPEPIDIDAEPKPVSPKLPVIPEVPELPPLDHLADIPSAFPEISEIPAKQEIAVINTEPKPVTAEILDIPEAPVLPPLALDKIPFFGKEEQLISGEPTEIYPTIPVRPSQPELIAIQTKPVVSEFTIIPEPSALPPLIIHNIPSAIGEETKLDEELISQRPTGVFPEIPEILANPDLTVINSEPRPITAELSDIPEAPVLPPLVLDKIPFFTGEEIKLEDESFSKEHKVVNPTISALPSQPESMFTENEPFNLEFTIIPKAPELPPLDLAKSPSAVEEEIKLEEQFSQRPTGVFPEIPEITVINSEPETITAEFFDIPEAPVLPPLEHDKISLGSTEHKLEGQLIPEESTSVYPTISEIVVKPETSVSNTEKKPIIQELPLIPEAPIIPRLVLDNIPSAIREEINLKGQLISGEQSSLYPGIPEILAKPEITVINTENKPIAPEFPIIPEAPVLPPLDLTDIHSAFEEKLILQRPTNVFPEIPELLTKPEKTIINTEIEPITAEFSDIPAAPVLPPLALEKMPFTNGEKAKLEERLISGESSSVYPRLSEILTKPDITFIDTENKPTKQDFAIIPEAPVLPSLGLNNIPSAIREEIQLEEQLLSGGPISVYPSIPEILAKPEITVINTENKPIAPEFPIIPEAPVLPPLTLADIPSAFEEEIKSGGQLTSPNPTGVFPEIPEILAKPEIIVIDNEPKAITAEFSAIPEAPVLPPQAFNNIAAAIGEMPADEHHTISEVSVEPEPIAIDRQPKPSISELPIIPEAPVLPSLVQEEMKFEEPLTLGEYAEISANPEGFVDNQELVESSDAMIPEPSTLLWSNGRPDLKAVKLEEKIKFEESIQEISRPPVAVNDKVNFFGLVKNPAPEVVERGGLEPALLLEELKRVYSIKSPKFVLKDVSRPNLYNIGHEIVINKKPSPEIILKPESRQGLFSFPPFTSPFSGSVLKKKKKVYV